MTSLKRLPFDFKTQYGLGFSSQDDEIVVDFFCGGGGAGTGTGLEMGLSRAVNIAKNHNPAAISICDKYRAHGNHQKCSTQRQAEGIARRAGEQPQ